MPDESKQDAEPEFTFPDGMIHPMVEALVVQQLLGRLDGYQLTRLRHDLSDMDPEWLEDSLNSLKAAGVLVLKRTRIHMTPATRRLDALDMICI
jgi:hypothetical protein